MRTKLGNHGNENLSVLELICVLHFGYAWGTVNSCTILIIRKVLRAWNCAVSCVNSQQLLQPNNGLLGLIQKQRRKKKKKRRRVASRMLHSPSGEKVRVRLEALSGLLQPFLWFPSPLLSTKLCKLTLEFRHVGSYGNLLGHAMSKRSLRCWFFFFFCSMPSLPLSFHHVQSCFLTHLISLIHTQALMSGSNNKSWLHQLAEQKQPTWWPPESRNSNYSFCFQHFL